MAIYCLYFCCDPEVIKPLQELALLACFLVGCEIEKVSWVKRTQVEENWKICMNVVCLSVCFWDKILPTLKVGHKVHGRYQLENY